MYYFFFHLLTFSFSSISCFFFSFSPTSTCSIISIDYIMQSLVQIFLSHSSVQKLESANWRNSTLIFPSVGCLFLSLCLKFNMQTERNQNIFQYSHQVKKILSLKSITNSILSVSALTNKKWYSDSIARFILLSSNLIKFSFNLFEFLLRLLESLLSLLSLFLKVISYSKRCQ